MLLDEERCEPGPIVVTRCLVVFLGLCAPCIESLRAQDGPPPLNPQDQRSRPGGNSALPALMKALDANGDGTIDAWELENATKLLRKLDRNGDGQLTSEELGLRRAAGDRSPRDPPSRQPAQR